MRTQTLKHHYHLLVTSYIKHQMKYKYKDNTIRVELTREEILTKLLRYRSNRFLQTINVSVIPWAILEASNYWVGMGLCQRSGLEF